MSSGEHLQINTANTQTVVMKSIRPVLQWLFLAVFSSQCSTTKSLKPPAGGSEHLYMHKWVLAAIDGKLVDSSKEVYLLFSPGQLIRVAGSTGCNKITGTATLTGESGIQFSPLATTRMACLGTNVESEFMAALSKVNDWRYTDSQLLFYHDNVLLLRFNAAVNQPDAALQLNGTWELNYITGPKIAFDGLYPKQKPQLVFTLPKEEVGGNTSCNVFGAPFKLDGSKISFGDARTTLMACEGPGEQTFLKTLKEVDHYVVGNDQVLVLLKGEITLMKFRKL